jgi:hypothetical protein
MTTMQTTELIQEIRQLPLTTKFYIMEEILKAIKEEELNHQMIRAADALYDDYAQDKDLTAFTSLDFENFYETK